MNSGLALALQSRGFNVSGRETFGEFQRLRFSEQIQVIADDLLANFWHQDALVVANSFGAYLFLHAQTLIPAFPGKVLLLSPIVGGSAAPGNGPRFSPPFAERLGQLAETNELVVPQRCEIHVGELGRVDKRDSQISQVLIQGCSLESNHGPWGFVGCGMGTDWSAAAT